MSDLPPIMRDQRKVDASHLRLISIFHFVFAGLAVLGLGFVILHYILLFSVFDNPETWKQSNEGPPPENFFMVMRGFYAFFGLIMFTGALGNLLSGLFINRRRHRLFSIIIAALNCVQIPLGTVLGIFTIIVLVRDSVQETYASDQQSLS